MEPEPSLAGQLVLEHIEDDGTAMAAMAAVLRLGGRLTLLVPAHQRLFNSLGRPNALRPRWGRGLVAHPRSPR